MPTSRYSAVSEGSTLQPSGPDSGQLPLLSETNTASESSQSIGPECRSSGMSRMFRTPDSYPRGGAQSVEKRNAGGHSVNLQDQVASQFSPVGSLANLIPLQENVRRLLTSVIYGQSAPGSQQSFDLGGPCLKTCRDFLHQSGAYSSPAFSVTWPRWGIAWDGAFGELTMLAPFTDATGCSSSPTIPTPRAEHDSGRHRGKEDTLHSFVKMWPTPSAEDVRDRGSATSGAVKRRSEKGRQIMLSQSVSAESGALNPDWVEVLMGFPAGWTELSSEESQEYRKGRRTGSKDSAPSETPSSPNKPIRYSKPSRK